MELITSRNNDKIKYAVKLTESGRFRRENGEFSLEGARLCSDAAESGVEIAVLFVTEEALSKYDTYVKKILAVAKNAYTVSKDVSSKLSDTKNPQGVFCICKMLDKNANIGKIKYNGKYIVLEDVSNPSNLGAVCRTAEALGLDGVIVGGGCDVYNPKALRASMGSLFRLTVLAFDSLSEQINILKENGMKIYSAVPDSDALPVTRADMSDGVVFVIGNEGNGISEEIKAASTALVTIPMKGRAESFNASVAASIVMWEMMR